MSSAVRELKQIPFAHLIGAPLKAAIESQALAAKTAGSFSEVIQTLFGPHLMLGYSKTVKVEHNNAMVKQFFKRIKNYEERSLRNAWIKAGKKLSLPVAALDSSGKKWV